VPKYSVGTIIIQGGSDIITGSGVDFRNTNVRINSLLAVWGIDNIYIIKEIIDSKTIRIDKPMDGVNKVFGVSYVISDEFTPFLDIPLPSNHAVNRQSEMRRFYDTIDREIPKQRKPPPIGKF
jgi:hypothetical protein